MNFEAYIRDIPDFPKPGILFKDITPLLHDPTALAASIKKLAELVAPFDCDLVAGIESRGFIFGTALAIEIDKGFVPIRKPGKLPYKTRSIDYELEYGSDRIEMHEDAVADGQRVLLVDDLLATGGTMGAAVRLVEGAGGVVAACACVIELSFLDGRKALGDREFCTILRY